LLVIFFISALSVDKWSSVSRCLRLSLGDNVLINNLISVDPRAGLGVSVFIEPPCSP